MAQKAPTKRAKRTQVLHTFGAQVVAQDLLALCIVHWGLRLYELWEVNSQAVQKSPAKTFGATVRIEDSRTILRVGIGFCMRDHI